MTEVPDSGVVVFTHGFSTDDNPACSFAVIDFTPDLFALVFRRREFLRTLIASDVDVAGVTFWDCNATWFNEADLIEACGGDETLRSVLRDQAEHFEDYGYCVLREIPKAAAARTTDDAMVVTEAGIAFRCVPRDAAVELSETEILEWAQIERFAKGDR